MNYTWAVSTPFDPRVSDPACKLAVWLALSIGVIALTFTQFENRLADRLDPSLDGVELSVIGEIDSLPVVSSDSLRFRFSPVPAQARLAGLPSTLAVRWFKDFPELRPGEKWRLRLRLRIPKGLVNYQGVDRERQWFTDGIGGLATVVAGRNIPLESNRSRNLDTLRYAVRENVRLALPPEVGRALVLSLGIGERSELESDHWKVLRQTGTGHLLAISGLHIGLAAIAGFWISRTFLWLLAPGSAVARFAYPLCCVGSFAIAALYGALAAYPVSTVRALAMLALGLLAVCGKRVRSPLKVWFAAVIAVVLIDPFALVRPGFWLSFCAVLALICTFAPRTAHCGRIAGLVRAQFAILFVMAPVTAFWFQSSSLLAFPANAVAIPWASLFTVPLVLLGTALSASSVSTYVLAAAAWSAESLFFFLEYLRDLAEGGEVQTPVLSVRTAIFGSLGGFVMLLPRGVTARWLGLCLLAVCFLPRASNMAHGSFELETLDVGQGLAVIVRTSEHTLLYDTGPGDGLNWSLSDQVLVPALQSRGAASPDLIVVSHADLDHAGGLAHLRARFPNTPVWINHPSESTDYEKCEARRSWRWDGVEFTVLHPTRWLPYRGNDSSCVIQIENGEHRVLLSGDISSVVERRLQAQIKPADLITVPHHGSASSSSDALLENSSPVYAIASAAHGNRFGFPRPRVVERYAARGSTVLSTSDCGAISAAFFPRGNVSIGSARAHRKAPWRWPASANCP